MKKAPKIVIFEVEGRGVFPLDMLRYDACYPSTEQDSHKIDFNPFLQSGPSFRKISLTHRVMKDEYLKLYPTNGRWESFGWKVVEGSLREKV